MGTSVIIIIDQMGMVIWIHGSTAEMDMLPSDCLSSAASGFDL